MAHRFKHCLILHILFFLHVCKGKVRSDFFCNNVEFCNHNQSLLCDYSTEATIAGISCNEQLKLTEDEKVSCQFQNISADCDVGRPSHVSSWDNLVFSLRMYYHRTWMSKQATLNLTFPSPTWKEMKFRYEKLYYGDSVLCRRLTLTNPSQPMVDTLFWDCPFFPFPEGSPEQLIKLSVLSDEGEGGSYIFTRPNASRFDEVMTDLQDWHTFFFVHVDHMYQSADLPITLQVAPHKFGSLMYNVSLVKCVDGKDCKERAVLKSRQIQPPENASEVTVLLPTWSSFAWYAVTVQIDSNICTAELTNKCYVAVSPPFAVAMSRMVIWIVIVLGALLICSFTFFVVINKRIKQARKMVEELKEKPVRVLVVYLPETQESFKLVNIFADFLTDCYVHPYLVDRLVGSQDPNLWTWEHFAAADRVLFLMPARPGAKSITHIRGQWHNMQQYLSGYSFLHSHDAQKIAVVIFPFSAEAPTEITSLRQFQLLREIDPLVTWLHGRTWLDTFFLRCPLITSLAYWNKDKLRELREALTEVSRASVKQGDSLEHKNYNDMSINCSDRKLLLHGDKVDDSGKVNSLKETMHEDAQSFSDDVFDLTIPDVYSVLDGNVSRNTRRSSTDSVEEKMPEDLFVYTVF